MVVDRDDHPARTDGRGWYVARVPGPRSSALVGAVVTAGLVAGCGGGDRLDAHEPNGTYRVAVEHASFPARQHLAADSELRITVRNADTRTIPDVAVTLAGDDPNVPGSGFQTTAEAPGLADPSRPLWVVDRAPRDGDTVYVGTWALGALKPGASRTFRWHVTPVVGGEHTIRWHVTAGLNGKAKAENAAGREAAGTFRVVVVRAPAQATVNAQTGAVVRSAAGPPAR